MLQASAPWVPPALVSSACLSCGCRSQTGGFLGVSGFAVWGNCDQQWPEEDHWATKCFLTMDCLMPVGGGTVPDLQHWKPRAPFFWCLQKTVGFPPAAEGLACQHSQAGGEGWVLTHAETGCAKARMRHSQEFLPAVWACCLLHVAHLHMLCACLPAHHTQNKHPQECALTPRCARLSRHSHHTRHAAGMLPRVPRSYRHGSYRHIYTPPSVCTLHTTHPCSQVTQGAPTLPTHMYYCFSGQCLPCHSVCDCSDITVCGSNT